MKNLTIRRNEKQRFANSRVVDGGSRDVEPRRQTMPTWWIVFKKELADLWIGGKALILTLIYSLVLGIMVYVLASSEELSLIPPKELAYEMLKNAMAVSLFLCLIIGADSISGERERNTLESLLLTPTNRRQIVIGKFLAALSFWPAALAIAIPYLYVLSQGDKVLGPTLFWGAILGTVLAMSYTGLGMLASFWSNSNKTSYFVSLGFYILFLVPAALPGRAQTGAVGQFLQWVNPVAAVNHFLSKHLVNYRLLSEFWTWLIPPAVFAALILGLLFLYAASGLRLEAGKTSKFLSFAARRFGLLVIIGLIVFLAISPHKAFQAERLSSTDLNISINLNHKTIRAGDRVSFKTSVTNKNVNSSPPLIVAMNIINLNAAGDVVDPEDWSPQRTQYVKSLASGESIALSWIINAIVDGDFMVYMVLIPTPESQDSTSQPVASSGIHLTVTKFTRLNPSGVLPYVLGGPIVILLLMLLVYKRRHMEIDTGRGGDA